ncbi:5747_t:CDS:2 [Paraglomus brasilianum]|uniref:5747_t:CDS:1 n=1 Tax=Paraglomus brasilianum TaxID=144538 RepID=A0A9N9H4T6_9GLOM|nr:5747_t:CDS:2 [Paraglomus brasilianum]
MSEVQSVSNLLGTETTTNDEEITGQTKDDLTSPTSSSTGIELVKEQKECSSIRDETSAEGTEITTPKEHAQFPYFKVGVVEDCNKRYRRTMEDAHCYFYDFAGVEGQGFFAIFDGHAGKQAAEWCGNHFHETFQEVLEKNATLPIPEVFNLTFAEADQRLNESAAKHSGCTAIAALVRTDICDEGDENGGTETVARNGTDSAKKAYKRALYTANVGDARAVLCRDGIAKRLSYDHKGSDVQEAKRIVDAGGFVLNNRVNGVLAVTRSLGDCSMKGCVVGAPYTTETALTEKDSFLILACDGLWDVCSDQDAVDLVKDVMDPQAASEKLLEYALQNFSMDNLSVMVVRFTNT